MNRIQIKPYREQAQYQAWAQQTPLLLLDCERLRQQYRRLRSELPGVDLYYAIKSLPHPQAIATLAAEGSFFDVASNGEIELLRQQKISPRRCLHTHPIKRDQDIRHALRYGCTSFVFDNIWELEKFMPYRHRVGLLLRLSFPNPEVPVDLSRKFGCRPEEAPLLLQKARQLGLHVKGLSFHVGSQCSHPDKHIEAIERALRLIEQQAAQGHLLSVLDIGGGFPADYQGDMDFQSFFARLRSALQQVPEHIQIIAEPGRYLSAPSMIAISRIIGKARRGEQVWYYLDDGIYGSYSGQLFDHARYPLTVFSDHSARENSVLAGPTCDSIDVIAENIALPPLNIGDLVIGEQMGAYTAASATDFNLFERAQIIAIHGPEQSRCALMR